MSVRNYVQNKSIQLLKFIIFGVLISGFGYAQNYRVASVLDEIMQRSELENLRGHKPIMIFDLDDTIFDAGSRTLHVLRQMASDPEFRSDLPNLGDQLESLKNDDIHYEFSDNLDMLRIHDPYLRERAYAYWSEHFFKQCDVDAIHLEAKEFVKSAHAQSVHVVYLTGRDEPNMRDCTIRSLHANGLPLGERATLMLKPDKSISDVTFKEAAFVNIESLGVIVAGFDNEPANVNAMAKKFPAAHIVFIDTRHSKKPDRPFTTITRYKWGDPCENGMPCK